MVSRIYFFDNQFQEYIVVYGMFFSFVMMLVTISSKTSDIRAIR